MTTPMMRFTQKLLPRRITGWTDGASVGFPELPFAPNGPALFEDFDWVGKLPLVSRANEIPLFWSEAAAALTFGETPEEYRANHWAAGPEVSWPRPLSPFRVPRAVIFGDYPEGHFRDIYLEALQGLQAELEEADIFAGAIQSYILGLPWREVAEDETGVLGAVFDPEDCRGGECLYLSVENNATNFAWLDFEGEVNQPVVDTYLAFTLGCGEKHQKAKWLSILGGPGEETNMERYALSVATAQSIYDTLGEMGELFVLGEEQIIGDPDVDAIVVAKLQQVVLDFFELQEE